MSGLLLTSNGLTNSALDEALAGLLERPVAESSVAFVTTAANPVREDKSWLVDDLRNVKRQRFAEMDVFDLAGLEPDDSISRFQKADVLVFGGGDAYYLLDVIDRQGLHAPLLDLLPGKVYVGISAGSIVTGPDLDMSSHCVTWGSRGHGASGRQGLMLTNLRVRPHLDSANFPEIVEENIAPVAEITGGPVYALDDQSALKIVGGVAEPVGRGRWIRFGPES